MTKTKSHFRLWLTLNQFSDKINTAVTNNWSVDFLLVLLLVIFPDAEKSKVITYKELWWTRVLKIVKMTHCSHHLCFSWYIFKNVTSHFSCSWWTLGVVPFPSLFNQSVFNLNWTELNGRQCSDITSCDLNVDKEELESAETEVI